MAPAPSACGTAASPGAAKIIVVRPVTACDTADHAVLVDEAGGFVGTLAPGTALALDVPPGRHAFFVWPGMDLRSEREPVYQPIGVLDATWAAGQTRFVRVDVVRPREGRGHCYHYAVFQFARAEPSETLEGQQCLVPDAAAGQALLRSKRDVTATYFTLARDDLDRRRAAADHAALRATQLQEAGAR
jgi:hypothetical protein